MSNKYRHTTIILLILALFLLIIGIIVVQKFFTKEEFKEITYTHESIADINLSNSQDTNELNIKQNDSSDDLKNEFSRSNVSTSSRSLTSRRDLHINNDTKNNQENITQTKQISVETNEVTQNSDNDNNTTLKEEEKEEKEQKSNNKQEENQEQNKKQNINSNQEQLSANSSTQKTTSEQSNNTSNSNKNSNEKTSKKIENNSNKNQSTKTNNNSNTKLPQDAIGNITIPKTGVNLPIMKTISLHNMDTATCLLYSTGTLNENGTTIIVGHNYQNGKLFSNNNKLKKGDKIYITAIDGTKKEYTIYDKFITTDDDISYLDKNTDNSPQIALSSCTDDEKNRIIILAK